MSEYNIFISWSGSRSRVMAEALHWWVGKIVQKSKPFMSSINIEAGSRTYDKIADQLESSEVGLICVTPENQFNTWLNFEAGALSKHLGKARVAPIILDMRKGHVKKPLGDYDANEIELAPSMFDVAKMVNSALTAEQTEVQLQENCNVFWQPFTTRLQSSLQAIDIAPRKRRDDSDMIEEALQIARGLSTGLSELQSDIDILKRLSHPNHWPTESFSA